MPLPVDLEKSKECKVRNTKTLRARFGSSRFYLKLINNKKSVRKKRLKVKI